VEFLKAVQPRVLRGILQITLNLPFNPAHAGNSNSFEFRLCCRSVQPRACGECFSSSTKNAAASRSTPQAGNTAANHESENLASVQPRAGGGYASLTKRGRPRESFNPAHARNTGQQVLMGYVTDVQPRVRGEYPVYGVPGLIDHRSTPRTRGIRTDSTDSPYGEPFNPAQAGDTVHVIPN
jgi:hypothetical protein